MTPDYLMLALKTYHSAYWPKGGSQKGEGTRDMGCVNLPCSRIPQGICSCLWLSPSIMHTWISLTALNILAILFYFILFTDVLFMRNNVIFGLFNFSNILFISFCWLLFPIPKWMAFVKTICIASLLGSLWCPGFLCEYSSTACLGIVSKNEGLFLAWKGLWKKCFGLKNMDSLE